MTSLLPVMSSWSATSRIFWEDAVACAQRYYGRWLMTSDRLSIQADALVNRYRDGKYARVDQRAASLLLAAVGSEIKEDVISLRLLGSASIVFKVMTKYQRQKSNSF